MTKNTPKKLVTCRFTSNCFQVTTFFALFTCRFFVLGPSGEHFF